MLTLKEQLLQTVRSHYANSATSTDTDTIDSVVLSTVESLVNLVTARNILHPAVKVAPKTSAAVEARHTVDDMLARTAVPEAPPPQPKPEPRVPSSTDREIRKVLQDLPQPFSRLDIFKALKWKGSTDITQAAVSGWVNRAVKRGEAVPALTSPQHYWLKGNAGIQDEQRPLIPLDTLLKPTASSAPTPVVIGKTKPASFTATPPFGDLDIVSGSGGVP